MFAINRRPSLFIRNLLENDKTIGRIQPNAILNGNKTIKILRTKRRG